MDHRDVIVSLRLTAPEAAHIDAAAATLARPRSRADYCRAAALHAAHARVPPPAKPIRRPARRRPALDTRLLGQILGQLGHIGGNLNQIAKTANLSGAAPTITAIVALTAEIAAVRQAVTAVLQGDKAS